MREARIVALSVGENTSAALRTTACLCGLPKSRWRRVGGGGKGGRIELERREEEGEGNVLHVRRLWWTPSQRHSRLAPECG